jgi:hypothetical protein
MGAGPWCARASTELRALGRKGLLSAGTVVAHLYHAYPKLGIASKAALRDALSQPDDR